MSPPRGPWDPRGGVRLFLDPLGSAIRMATLSGIWAVNAPGSEEGDRKNPGLPWWDAETNIHTDRQLLAIVIDLELGTQASALRIQTATATSIFTSAF